MLDMMGSRDGVRGAPLLDGEYASEPGGYDEGYRSDSTSDDADGDGE